MRSLRILLLCLLSLVIPAYGYAALGTAALPCPMTQHHATGDAASAHGGADCCDDADATAATGQPCKMGQDCPTGGLAWLLPKGSLAVQVTQPTVHRFHTEVRIEPAQSNIWRPPARC
ncbi:hypothetical protein [Rhodoferax sp.]|uniref:hypothetical protein n=1 Tax=Rhodoferax sp. TaxID=50421 RepID=UPI002764F031|nr:hypothetical protein [Rhodoferax sp.]